MNKRISLTAQAQAIVQQQLNQGDIAIDATVGNGYDTLFLAKQVGTQGYVFGFDIQNQAIQTSRIRLKNEQVFIPVKLIQACHSTMKEQIPIQYQGNIKAIMFNLGYLPHGDKTIITQTDSTLIALNDSVALLSVTGMISIIAYSGHQGGEIETHQINQWCEKLNPNDYNIQIIHSSDKITAPKLFIIQKISLSS